MSAGRLAAQLRALRVQLALEPSDRTLRVRIAATRRQLDRLAAAPDAEALPELLAKLARGELTTDQLGAAIARDGHLASQVQRAIDLTGAQTGDVQVGQVAGGNIYHIYYGGADRER